MNKGEIIEISIDEVVPNPHQPRKVFDEKSLLELADSIRQHGLLQPIVVRLNQENKYELIAGERRLRASELIKNKTITAIVKAVSARDSAYLAMIENVQRDDLHFVEIAKGYKELMIDFNITQIELISIVGKSQSAIANKIRILTLSENAQALLMKYKLSERHGRCLLKLKNDELQIKTIEHIQKQQLNVKDSESYVKKILKDKDKKIIKKPEVKRFIKDIRLFTNTIKQAVDAINSAGMEAKYIVREEEDKYIITIDIPIER